LEEESGYSDKNDKKKKKKNKNKKSDVDADKYLAKFLEKKKKDEIEK